MNVDCREPYYLHFTPLYRYRLEARLVPYYILHFYAHPYRKDVPAIGYKRPAATRKRRRRDALYDAMFNILMRGYSELTGYICHPSTGQLLLFLAKVMKTIDDSFERRLRVEDSLDLSDVMAESAVRKELDLLQAYLALFGCLNSVMEHLHDVYATYYQAYAHHLVQTRNQWHFDEVLASVEFDSGILLRAMLEMAAMFNGHRLADGTLADFYQVGMAGKFADDMVDLARDIKAGLPNLVYALMQQNPTEVSALEDGIQSGAKLNSAWWQAHCPVVYAEFFERISFYISRITVPHLKLACDLSLLPAIIGRDYDKVQEMQVVAR